MLKIKENRETARLSQQQLADLIKVPREMVDEWEKGIACPDAETLMKAASILGCDSEQLLSGEPISLHDSNANSINVEKDKLVFTFNEGYTVVVSASKFYKTVGATAEMIFRKQSNEPVTVYLFERKSETESIRKTISLQQLCQMINHEGNRLEFITQYNSYWTTLFECVFWFDQEPYHQDIAIYVDMDHMEYHWQKLKDY